MLAKSSKNILLQNLTKYKTCTFHNLYYIVEGGCLISYFVSFQFCGWTNLINLISPSQQSEDFLFYNKNISRKKGFTKPVFPSNCSNSAIMGPSLTKSLFVWKVQTSFLSDSPPWSRVANSRKVFLVESRKLSYI